MVIKMIIRKAELKDVADLLEIYNYEVLNGVATLDLKEKTIDDRIEWFNHYNKENHPLIVCECDGRAVGYASLSPYRDKEAYKSCVELSVYVHPEYRGRKIASALMEKIILMAREDGRTHTVVSVITNGNKASTRLHEKFGFEFCGCIKEIGEKFGKYRDIDNYRLGV